MDEVTPFPNHIICMYIPGLNNAQRDLCIQYPKLVPLIIQEVPPLFYSECREQFKYERWNCSETVPPIAGDLSKDLKRCKWHACRGAMERRESYCMHI